MNTPLNVQLLFLFTVVKDLGQRLLCALQMAPHDVPGPLFIVTHNRVDQFFMVLDLLRHVLRMGY